MSLQNLQFYFDSKKKIKNSSFIICKKNVEISMPTPNKILIIKKIIEFIKKIFFIFMPQKNILIYISYF